MPKALFLAALIAIPLAAAAEPWTLVAHSNNHIRARSAIGHVAAPVATLPGFLNREACEAAAAPVLSALKGNQEQWTDGHNTQSALCVNMGTGEVIVVEEDRTLH